MLELGEEEVGEGFLEDVVIGFAEEEGLGDEELGLIWGAAIEEGAVFVEDENEFGERVEQGFDLGFAFCQLLAGGAFGLEGGLELLVSEAEFGSALGDFAGEGEVLLEDGDFCQLS